MSGQSCWADFGMAFSREPFWSSRTVGPRRRSSASMLWIAVIYRQLTGRLPLKSCDDRWGHDIPLHGGGAEGVERCLARLREQGERAGGPAGLRLCRVRFRHGAYPLGSAFNPRREFR